MPWPGRPTPDGVRKPANRTRWSACFGADRGACSISAQWRTLAGRAGMDFLIDISPYRDKKNAALRAHRTQYPGLKKLFNHDTTTAFEAFRVAWGPRPHTIPAADLFTE